MLVIQCLDCECGKWANPVANSPGGACADAHQTQAYVRGLGALLLVAAPFHNSAIKYQCVLNYDFLLFKKIVITKRQFNFIGQNFAKSTSKQNNN